MGVEPNAAARFESRGERAEHCEIRLTSDIEIYRMIALQPEPLNAISTYLAAQFPPKPAPSAILIAGPAMVNIREWLVPTIAPSNTPSLLS